MLKYLHNGFIAGVPARDLTDEEAARFGKQRLVKSGLYEEARKPRVKKIENEEPAIEQAEE